MIFSAVLRRSLAFGPEHVEWLGRQVAKHYPEAEFRPFTDTPLSIPHEILHDGLPAWWSKFEALRRLDDDDTVVMMDLDTVIVRRIELPVPPPGKAYMQCSPWDIDKIWGGMQISSPEFRREVSATFYQDPAGMIEASGGCDQKYYAAHHRKAIKPLNTACPDGFVSYKLSARKYGIRPENAFIMFHGLPRPWHADHDWIPPLHVPGVP